MKDTESKKVKALVDSDEIQDELTPEEMDELSNILRKT